MGKEARAAQTADTLASKRVFRYALGSLGTGGYNTLPGLVLVYYLTDSIKVTALAAGIILAVTKIWDVLIDPVIGALSDYSLRKRGSRKLFMVIGALSIPLFFTLTFAVPPGTPPLLAAIWVVVAFLLSATAFSLFQVPYLALPAELTPSYDERTRILSWRVIVLTVAILLFGAGGPELRSAFENESLGYLIMALAAGIVISVAMLIASKEAPTLSVGADAVPPKPARGSILRHYRESIAVLKRSRPLRILLAGFAIQALAIGLMLATAQYIAAWVLHDPSQLTFLFASLVAPALLFTPLWKGVADRIGKERGFIISSVVFGLAALSTIGLLVEPGPWLYVPVVLVGIGFAGMQSLPMAMLPDVISHDAKTHGEGHAGTFSGVWTAGETTGLALGAMILTVALTIGGYIESAAGEIVVQPESAVVGIILSFSVLPAVLIGLSFFFLRRYPLRKVDIE